MPSTGISTQVQEPTHQWFSCSDITTTHLYTGGQFNGWSYVRLMLVKPCEMSEEEVQYRACQLSVSTEHRVETLG